jgi:hypothetical protein
MQRFAVLRLRLRRFQFSKEGLAIQQVIQSALGYGGAYLELAQPRALPLAVPDHAIPWRYVSIVDAA